MDFPLLRVVTRKECANQGVRDGVLVLEEVILDGESLPGEVVTVSGVVSVEFVVGAEVGEVWMFTSEAMISRSKSASTGRS